MQSIDIIVKCTCGRELEGEIVRSPTKGTICIEVPPCTDCGDESYAAGKAEGAEVPR